MWVLYAFGSAFFAGITAVLAKIGIQNVNSHLATALRTIVVVLFAWLMVGIAGSGGTIFTLKSQTWVFLILSGAATGASWICYFRALQLGDVNKVAPIDKSSTVLTMVLAFLFLNEAFSANMLIGMVLILAGTMLMIQKKEGDAPAGKSRSWFVWAVLSAVFASLTAILGKVGIQGVESNLGTAIRTVVVLILAWGIVFGRGLHKEIGKIDKKSWLFLALSGLATGLSWMLYYHALQEGSASIVAPIDKLSILVTILFSFILLKEKLNRKSAVGLGLLTAGTLLLLVHF
ncbi:EamA family transporter [Caproicibacterium amylolyticum]|jgi:transporter family protein|uniref:EamA family transporter n=1 Tax=Caproicibacterium amylolyticum TaxID=2766537 RepID=A0A7G9WE43_9FIRM|nr:EamA family transporter [Caproicibacterium amylolyticum]QNO16955.1 EamA family transporter [Caproicibacterium amylolyticum]